MKLLTFDFWFSWLNIRNTMIHMIIGTLIYTFTFHFTWNVKFSFMNLIIFALTIEIVQWVQRRFVMKNKWADSIRDFFTYFPIAIIFYLAGLL